MLNATQIRKGMVIKYEGQLYKVLEAVHITPGRWKAMIQTKLRSLSTESQTEVRFRSEDRVEQAILEELQMEYLYQSGDDFVFMNQENYDQVKLSQEVIGDGVNYLIPNIVFMLEMYEGRPVSVNPPLTVELKVVQTDPYLKGATQSASAKPATLETGLVVMVPQFVQEGDIIKIDTREYKYLERAK